MTGASTFAEQYDALRDAGGFVQLPHWSSIALRGADRQKFLNNFSTNDVKQLAPGTCCEAFFTNVKGKILGHGIVSCRQDELVVVGVPGQAAPLVEHLDRYLIREDVQLRDATAERSYLVVAGGNAARERFEQFKSKVASHGIATHVLAWSPLGSEFGCLLELPTHNAKDAERLLAEAGFAAAGAAFTAARLEAGVPLFGVDFDERHLPQEVGRDRQAISFTKGCYLGQETVARIDALGHVNQRLAGVRFFGDEAVERQAQLRHADKNAGYVTSTAFSPRLGAPLALAMLRREAHEPGTRLTSATGPCEVVRLPLDN